MRKILLRCTPAAVLLLALLVPASLLAEGPEQPPNAVDRPRLVSIKVDGLSPQILNALIDPDNPASLAQLPDPEGYRQAIALFRAETGRHEVIPNIRRYFYEQGIRTENMVSATITLSSVSWGVIQTGQPSIVKRHMTFSRQTGYRRSHLDGFRDTFNIISRSARKTSVVWQLDQAGVSMFADAFHPYRTYVTPWMYYRQTPVDYLADLGKHWLHNGESGWGIARAHLARRVDDMNYPEWQEQFVADHIAKKILEEDSSGQERYDYISTFFTIDHQYHTDPDPNNIVHRMARIDRRVGRILNAVERSKRRDQTLVTVLSDHGSEYSTESVNLTFPLTRIFRTRFLGGNTVSSVMIEDAAHALSAPVQGISFPRIFESPYSPYNQGKGGEKGYPTSFIDNFGNARSEVHLRNNDLNRLHLLLLARKRKLNNDHRAELRLKLEATLASIQQWLEPDYDAYFDYYAGVQSWLPFLKDHADSYWREAGTRLTGENERDQKILSGLGRLLRLCRAEDPIAWLDQHRPKIPALIPKKYFGPHNSVYQLSHYTVNLDENMEWVETVLDPRGRTVPMDYFSVLSDFEAPNPPQSFERNPVNLIVTSLPVRPIEISLRVLGWLPAEVKLKQAAWLVSTAKDQTTRGDQALVLESTEGLVGYLPIQNLHQDEEGQYSFDPAQELDPLGLFYDPEFQSPNGLPAYLWVKSFHTYDEWVSATHQTQYTIAPLVILDMTGVNALSSIDNPEYKKSLVGFPDEENKARYLRGLRWKFAAQKPDLLLWSSFLWNFSSKSHTAGGSHGGLPPHVAKTAFLLWGGRNFSLPQGTALSRPSTTLDVVPTLAQMLGMLSDEKKVIRQPGAYWHRPMLPLPGNPLPLPALRLVRQEDVQPASTAPPAGPAGNQ
jgi:hypothetical protein